jgi:hypothetical protein
MYQFGMLAKGLGYLQEQQMMDAIRQQNREIQEGQEHRSIGRICTEMGYLSPWEVERILECQSVARDWEEVVCGYTQLQFSPMDAPGKQ